MENARARSTALVTHVTPAAQPIRSTQKVLTANMRCMQAVVADAAPLAVAVPQRARTAHQAVAAILIRVAPAAFVTIAAVTLDTGHVGVFLAHAVRRRHAGISHPAAAGTSRTALHACGAMA